MIRGLVTAFVYLAVALALEIAVMPQFQVLLPKAWEGLFDLRLLAMAAILAGMMRGEMAGMIVGAIAAALYGFAQLPGQLGAAIVSFTAIGYLGGLLARHFRLAEWAFVGFWITVLLLAERVIWMMIRGFFFPRTPLALTWAGVLAIMLTAAAGAWLYQVFAPRLRRNVLFEDED